MKFNPARRPGSSARARRFPFPLALALAAAGLGATAPAVPAPRPGETAAKLAAAARAPAGGMAAIVGARTPALARAFAMQGRFYVHCLSPDRRARDQIRSAAQAAALAAGIAAETLADPKTLPYIANLLNVVVCRYPVADSAGAAGVPGQELFRVLAPQGILALEAAGTAAERALRRAGFQILDPRPDWTAGKWLLARKPRPQTIDAWTHYLHAADSNPVARDTVVGPPRHYHWIAKPLWLRSHETDASIRTLVCDGRHIVFLENEAPISLAGMNSLPDKWVVKARDAFNGMELWKVPLEQFGWRQWKTSWFTPRPGDIPLNITKRLVAVNGSVFVTLAYKAPVTRIDAQTGRILQTYPQTHPAGELLVRDHTLLVSRYRPQGLDVMAVDLETGNTRWVSRKQYRGSTVDYYRWRAMHGRIRPSPVDPTLNLATDGQTVALLDGPAVVALDFASGKEKWRTQPPQAPRDQRSGSSRGRGSLWVGALTIADQVVIVATPYRLDAISAETGKLLWSRPKAFIGHLWYEWKDVFVIDHRVWTWTDKLKVWRHGRTWTRYPPALNGYDIATGKLVRQIPTGPIYKTYHHHRCYRDKATVRYIITSRRGTECVSLHGAPHTVDNWVRGACHNGMMPANGMLYVPPNPCQCYIQEKINSFNALDPARPGEKIPEPLDAPARPEPGPAFGTAPAEKAAPDDWPTFRADASRSGAGATRLPDRWTLLWKVRPGLELSAPSVAAQRLFVALPDEHRVLALDARRGGRLIWSFTTGARVDSPPTYYRGRVIFGTHGGWVHCLRADDGREIWRFHAAPRRRLIAAYGQLESAWPVHGSVLVQNGTVFFAAGRSSELDGGIFLYALDPRTGAVRAHARLAGPYYNSKNIQENFRLPEGSLSDILMGDGTRVYMRTRAFNQKLQLQTQAPPPPIQPRDGFLDGAYFKRMPWTCDHDYARILVRDKRSVYYVRMFDTLRGLDPTVYFVPGSKGYLLFAKNLPGNKRPWMERLPVRVRAMLAAGNRLVVAGPPDIVPRKDPLAAFEGRAGGLLYLIDARTGKALQTTALDAPPVFNGIAAARGRLYICDVRGAVSCYGRSR